MKLTLFALLSAVALALTTNTPTQDNTSILNESDIPEGFPRNVEELGKMVDDFDAESDAAYVDGINVETNNGTLTTRSSRSMSTWCHISTPRPPRLVASASELVTTAFISDWPSKQESAVLC